MENLNNPIPQKPTSSSTTCNCLTRFFSYYVFFSYGTEFGDFHLQSLPKKFVRCSARTCIFHIKHLLKKKLDIPDNYEVCLLYLICNTFHDRKLWPQLHFLDYIFLLSILNVLTFLPFTNIFHFQYNINICYQLNSTLPQN